MSNPEIKTNIVVISWNAVDFTRATIERLFSTANHPYTLTVVDNNSTDSTRKYLNGLNPPDNCEELRTIMNDSNLGPGGAYSQGYEVSRELGTRYTALCNNDLYFQNLWLERLEKTMDNNQEIGILGTLQPTTGVIHPGTDSKDAKQVLRDVPNTLTIDEEIGHYFDEGFELGAKRIVDANGGGIRFLDSPPDAVPTSCAIVRNSAVEEIGFIADPIYEVYGTEDIDLSWELGRLGYRCAIDYDVYVHHFRHRSVKANRLDMKKHLIENNKKFAEKWFGTIAVILEGYERRGIQGSQLMDNENNQSFLRLRRINDNAQFWKNGNLS